MIYVYISPSIHYTTTVFVGGLDNKRWWTTHIHNKSCSYVHTDYQTRCSYAHSTQQMLLSLLRP